MCPLPAFMLNRRRVANRFAGADADAVSYLQAVEAADGQNLEQAAIAAVNSLVVGLKSDGLWASISCMCLLSCARTLAGALTPMRGPAPANSGFVSSDYNRRTGLSNYPSQLSKYIDTNYSHTADGQNNRHMAVGFTVFSLNGTNQRFIGVGASGQTGSSYLGVSSAGEVVTTSVGGASDTPSLPIGGVFFGASRSTSASYTMRMGGTTQTASRTSQSPRAGNIYVMASNSSGPTGYANTRVIWYSAGSAVDLAALDSRVTAYANALAAFLP